MRRNFLLQLLFTPAFFIYLCSFISSCNKSNDTRRIAIDTVTVINNVKYGSNKNWQGNNENLLLDIYTPPDSLYAVKFPLIVYVHGGGFQDGTKEENKTLMKDFAASGFISVSIDYRLGWTQADSCVGDTTEGKEAVYRAVQDARSAIRFLVANAAKYKIDTNWIFLSGESAGAITVLSSNYFTQSYANSFLPRALIKLGALDYADNNLKNAYTIKGIASVSGCLNDAGIINAQNAKPTIYMHGLLDNVIPCNEGTAFECPNFTKCFGSSYLYNVTKSLVPCVLHIDSTAAHSVYDEPFIKANQTCFFNSIIHGNIEAGYYTGEISSCK